jgi:S1-C subfamily serine protease
VSLLDLVLVLVIVMLALSGFRRGLVVGLASLAGLLIGGYIGIKLAPDVLSDSDSRYTPLVTFGGAVVGAVLGQSLAIWGARSLRGTSRDGPFAAIDSLGGLALGLAVGLVFSWVLGAAMLYAPGQSELRRYAQESRILSALNDQVPPERIMDALSRVDPFTAIAGPQANVAPPSAAAATDPDVLAAGSSVLRVTGYACGLGIEGSGWIAQPELVVTNAHVVAGVNDLRVDRGDGAYRSGQVVAFDRRNDLAVIRVPGLGGRPLPLADAKRGVSVALLGYPENGPFVAVPARLGQTVSALARDAYGSLAIGRDVVTVRGSIHPGNSGGPAVDGAGRVRTVVYAQRIDKSGGYGVPVSFVRDLLAAVGPTPVETDCVDR